MDNLRRGILLFTAFLFVATTIIGFALALNYYEISVTKEAEPDWNYSGEKAVNQADTKVTRKTNNVLVVIGDKGVEHSEIMFISNFDTEKKNLSFIYVPKDMKYSVEANVIPDKSKTYNQSYNTGTVSQLYSRFKGEDMTKILSYMLDISIDRYLFLSFDDCEKLFNGFTLYEEKGLWFDFPISVSNEEMGISITISGDESKWFDGQKAVDLMRFYKTSDGEYSNELLQYYDGTDIKRLDMVRKFTDTFIKNQFLGDKSSKSYYIKNFHEIAYKKVIATCDTNIDSGYVTSFQNLINSTNASSISYYTLKCDVSGGNAFQYIYTDCLYDHVNVKALSREETIAVLDDKF